MRLRLSILCSRLGFRARLGLGLYLLLVIWLGQPTIAFAQSVEQEQRAAEAIREGRFAEALTLLNQVLDIDGRNVNALILRASAYEGRSNNASALADYEQVLRIDPQNLLAREGVRRTASRSSGSVQRTLEGLQLQVATNPNDQGLLLRYAHALYDAHQFRQAARYYDQYLQLGQPVPDIVHRYLISIASYEGDNDQGEQAAERFLALFPSDSNLHMRLGYFRLWQGKRQAAQNAFTEALRLNPGNTDAQQGLAKAQNQAQEAPASGPVEFIVDRLMRELKSEPENDDKRFDLVQQLIHYERFFEAYDQLVLLAERHDTTERWLDLITLVDEALTRTAGASPDRLLYRLRYTPDDLKIRYALVKALTDSGRISEAYATLTERPYANPIDPQYQALMQRLIEVSDRLTQERLAELERQVEQDPGNVAASRALIESYLLVQRVGDALALYERLVVRLPDDEALGLAYVTTLRQQRRYTQALRETQRLLERNPLDARYKMAYVLASLAAGEKDLLAQQYLAELLTNNPGDIELLLNLVELYLEQDQPQAAATYLQRAQALNAPGYQQRIANVQVLVARAQAQAQEKTELALIEEARRLAQAQAYDDALARFEDYFAELGYRSRAGMIEVAQIQEAAGELDQALATLAALQAQQPEYRVAKQIAKLRLYKKEFAAARRDLEILVNDNPGDYEVRLLLGDAYREQGRYDLARDTYREILEVSPTSRLARERLTLLDNRVRIAGAYGAISYGLQIAPVSEFVMGSGSGTDYERRGQGVSAQIFIPLPVVFNLGFVSHDLNGTRRLVPQAEGVASRINEVYVGGSIDLTRPVSAIASYTNRLTFRAGVHDYEGQRRVPFGSLHYWRQDPGRYTASIGVQNTEGSLALWSPAGQEFDLRLTQVDVRASLFSILPDSLLRLQGTVLVNVVSDHFGTLGNSTGSNYGVHLMLDAGYRVLDKAYLGVRYDRLDYDTTVDIYYSPNQFQSYYLWLEYDRQARTQPLTFRVRGSLGVSGRTSGFVSRQMESSLTYRLSRKLSLSMNMSLGQSSRPFTSAPTRTQDRYSTVIFTGSVFWSL